MAADEQQEKWYFTKEQLANTPSQKCGYDADKELSCRQQAANFIQDMGQRLQVTQLCINTAIVYMHRFYMFHSFSRFHRTAIAAAALFLAAKVEEQPRKLEHVIKVAQICLHREQPPPDTKSEIYMEQAQELVVNENILLQTLGFDVAIDHPHTHVVRCCHLVRASKDLAQTSYFMASNSLHLTTMCLQYKPTVVACFCIHLACKWSDWEIPQSNEGKPWFWYVDKTVSQELLEQLTEEFLVIFDKCPSRLKKKIMSLSSSQNQTILSAFGREDKKRNGEGSSASMAGGSSSGLSVEDMKKKQEFQRHHADYKKHHISHRSDSHSMPGKSSCLFGPPQKTQPPSASSHVSQSRLLAKPSLPPQPQLPPAPHQQQQQSSQSDITGISKPDHLHHRPRRPDDKHVRNHESLRDPYKKYENKLTGAILSDFSQTSSNGGSVSTKSVVSNNNNNNSSSSGVALSSASGFPVEPLPSSVQHGGLTEPVTVKNELIVAPAALAMSKVLQQSVAPHSKPKTPPSVQQPPPPVKTERSIFSPEKSTPPSAESRPQVIPPLTGMKRKRSTSSETDMLLLPIKVEPPSHYDVVSQETLVPKEEKPPDQSTSVEQLQFSSTSPALTEQANHPFQQPFLPQQSDQPLTLNEESHTKEQKKKKKRHRDHKEKHKDKHKHKHRNRDPEPIVITIPKEKLTLPQQPEQGLKLKIPREKLTGLQTSAPATATVSTAVATGLKLKISQGKIKESRKREKAEEERTSPPQGLPSKYHRPNGTTLQVNKEIELLDCPDNSETEKTSFAVDALPTSSLLLDDCGPSFDDFTGLSTPPGMSQDIMAMFNPDPSYLKEVKPTSQAGGTETSCSQIQTDGEVKSEVPSQPPDPCPQIIPDPSSSQQTVPVQSQVHSEPPPGPPQLDLPPSYTRQNHPRQPYNKGGRGRQENSGSYRGRGRGGYQRGGGGNIAGLPSHSAGGGGYRSQDLWNYSMQQMAGYVAHHHGRMPSHQSLPPPHHQMHLRAPPPSMQPYAHLLAHQAPTPAYFTAPMQSQHPMVMHPHHYSTGPPLPDEPPPLRPPPPPE